jgi:hypothetical protein
MAVAQTAVMVVRRRMVATYLAEAEQGTAALMSMLPWPIW